MEKEEEKMKIAITNNDKDIAVFKDFSNMDTGLIGQTIMELELLKQELLDKYGEVGSEREIGRE